MNMPSILLWGFVATMLLAAVLVSSQGLGLTRMSIPFILGTIITPDRDRAMWWGTVWHVMNGWLFSSLYALVFESLHRTGWWLGASMGVVQGLIVLTVAMPLIPAAHPRMVSEYVGPSPNRRLQPPGFMALHYGRRTPLVTLLAHALFGAILGTFYQLVA
jgi:uncharacterized membrane protein YagU involved in acid resistance